MLHVPGQRLVRNCLLAGKASLELARQLHEVTPVLAQSARYAPSRPTWRSWPAPPGLAGTPNPAHARGGRCRLFCAG
jgi:hypothetical protein